MSKSTVDSLFSSGGKDRDIVWDDKLKGFGVIVYRWLKDLYVAEYPKDGRSHRAVIGKAQWRPDCLGPEADNVESRRFGRHECQEGEVHLGGKALRLASGRLDPKQRRGAAGFRDFRCGRHQARADPQHALFLQAGHWSGYCDNSEDMACPRARAILNLLG
jgi:hypothetical protein